MDRRLKLSLGVLALLAAALVAFLLAAPRETARSHTWRGPWRTQTEWQSAAPGLSWKTLTRPASDGMVKVTAVRAETRQWSVRVVEGRTKSKAGVTARQMCPSAGAAINAGFFSMADRSPIGWVVADGRTISPPCRRPCTYGPWGVFTVRGGACAISPLEPALPTDVLQAAQSAPILLARGRLPQIPNSSAAPWAAVGVDQKGAPIFAVAEGGLTLQEWAACLQEQLHLRDALNLDGGPSAQLALRGQADYATPTAMAVPIFLQLTRRAT